MRNLHSTNSAKKMLAHGAQQGMGPFRPHSKHKKAVLSATNTQDGKAEQASNEPNYSTAIIGGIQEEIQDGKR